MSIPQYDVKEVYTGTGSLDSYTFDFKITLLTQLLVVVVNDLGVETQRLRGDDTSFIDSVDFDSVLGGGTVNLLADLPTDYQIILLLADDAPTQDYEFRNKTSFTLRRFESALDSILGAVQRLVYRANQSLRIHDLDNEETFNTQISPGIADQAGRVFKVNDDGDGLDFGPLTSEIANAQAYAIAAQAAQTASEAAQSAAEVAQVAAEFAAATIVAPTFVTFDGPILGTLVRNQIGIIKSGASFALTLSNVDLIAGDVIEVKFLGFTAVCTVTPTSANIEGASSKVLMDSANASYKFRYTGSEWIIT